MKFFICSIGDPFSPFLATHIIITHKKSSSCVKMLPNDLGVNKIREMWVMNLFWPFFQRLRFFPCNSKIIIIGLGTRRGRRQSRKFLGILRLWEAKTYFSLLQMSLRVEHWYRWNGRESWTTPLLTLYRYNIFFGLNKMTPKIYGPRPVFFYLK